MYQNSNLNRFQAQISWAADNADSLLKPTLSQDTNAQIRSMMNIVIMNAFKVSSTILVIEYFFIIKTPLVKFLLSKSEVDILSVKFGYRQVKLSLPKILRLKAKLHYEVTSLR